MPSKQVALLKQGLESHSSWFSSHVSPAPFNDLMNQTDLCPNCNTAHLCTPTMQIVTSCSTV